MKYQQFLGGVHEFLGALEDGRCPASQSNEDYGTIEASLIQENGDQVCDLLYTNNFAFLGLREAAFITKDEKLQEAEAKLALFYVGFKLAPTTFRSSTEFGCVALMRSFGNIGGSNAHLSWGAWCVETGWINSWIAAVLVMRVLGETLYIEELKNQLTTLLPKLKAELGLDCK